MGRNTGRSRTGGGSQARRILRTASDLARVVNVVILIPLVAVVSGHLYKLQRDAIDEQKELLGLLSYDKFPEVLEGFKRSMAEERAEHEAELRRINDDLALTRVRSDSLSLRIDLLKTDWERLQGVWRRTIPGIPDDAEVRYLEEDSLGGVWLCYEVPAELDEATKKKYPPGSVILVRHKFLVVSGGESDGNPHTHKVIDGQHRVITGRDTLDLTPPGSGAHSLVR
ncbi:MAG: hypothetical protein R3E97_01845 [Candidatus Eisenbacteria bacterium]